MKKGLMTSLVILMTFVFAGLASAHVTVSPKEAPQGSFQVFTVRVPSEKDSATTSVRVTIPDGVNVTRFEPKTDWNYEAEKNADGKIVSVKWTAMGTGLGATEFGEFRMQGKVADDAKELVWKAYQTYADGETVEWTGAPDAEKPASITTVTPAEANGIDESHGGPAEQNDAASAGRDPLTLSLAIAGFAAGLAALLVTLFRRRT